MQEKVRQQALNDLHGALYACSPVCIRLLSNACSDSVRSWPGMSNLKVAL
jgi:hypothetical protein